MQQPIPLKTAANIQSPSVLLIYAGGTLGMVSDEEESLLHPLDFHQLVHLLPELRNFEMHLFFVSIQQPIDSATMNPEHWVELARLVEYNYHQFDAFVILHGTDTMAYTASALSFMLQGLNKPLILTGAQLPLGVPRTDARENLISSLEIATARANNLPLVSEVCIYFDYTLLRGNRCTKYQGLQFNAFVSENYPVLADIGVSINYHTSHLKPWNNQPLRVYTELDTNIALLKIFPGISELFVKSILTIQGLKAVVLETYGCGNALMDSWFLDSLKEAIAKGIVIVNVSQCLGGSVLMDKYETGRQLKEAGVLSGYNMTTEAAITKLMCLCALMEQPEEVSEAFVKPLSGEMDIL